MIYKSFKNNAEQFFNGPGQGGTNNCSLILTGTVRTEADHRSDGSQQVVTASYGDLYKASDGTYFVFIKNDSKGGIPTSSNYDSNTWYKIPGTGPAANSAKSLKSARRLAATNAIVYTDDINKELDQLRNKGYTVTSENYEITKSDNWEKQIVASPDTADAEYSYYVVETRTLEGYSVSYSNEGAKAGGTINITNKKDEEQTAFITLKKKDNHNSPLGGASFKIIKDATLVQISTSEQDGIHVNPVNESESVDVQANIFEVPSGGVTISGLGDGNYSIVEVVAPNGYIITNSTPITFSVNAGMIINPVTVTEISSYANGEFTVINTPGEELPYTGGTGTRGIAALGILLMAGSAAVLLIRRRILC